MSQNESLENYLQENEVIPSDKGFSLNQIKQSVDKMLGKTIHGAASLKKGRLNQFKADYSDLEHINTGDVTIRGFLATAAYSGMAMLLPYEKNDPIFDFSKESLTKAVNHFNDTAQQAREYQEVLTFISENFFNSPDVAASAFQLAIAGGLICIGAYTKNGLKRNNQIENICKEVDSIAKHKNFSLEHAKDVFRVLDSFYEYRKMYALTKEYTKNFIKDITAPILYGIKNNISNPVINKLIDIFGEENCRKITDKLKDLTPKIITNFFKKDKTITPNDMILYIHNQTKKSILNQSTNEPIKLNMQEELSKVAKDVYETMQITQTKKALILATRNFVAANKQLEELKEKTGIKNKLQIRKSKKLKEQSLELIKSIESLSSLDKKDNRISRFTIISNTANRILEKYENKNDFSKVSSDVKIVSKGIHAFIFNEEKIIKDLYLNNNNNFYANDIDKLMMPKTYSFERIFKEKVDELIEQKTNEIKQKRNQINNKLKKKL